jgi:hypothetical protein
MAYSRVTFTFYLYAHPYVMKGNLLLSSLFGRTKPLVHLTALSIGTSLCTGPPKTMCNRRPSSWSTHCDHCGTVHLPNDLTRPFFFAATVMGATYLPVLQDNILPSINCLFLETFFQQDGAPPYCYSGKRNFLNDVSCSSVFIYTFQFYCLAADLL